MTDSSQSPLNTLRTTLAQWKMRLQGMIPPVFLEVARRLGLRRSIAVLLLGWLALLLAINVLFPIDVTGYSLSALFIVLYLLPGLIAIDQGHAKRRTLFVLTLLFGWTVVGWLALLAWALLGGRREAAQEAA